MGLGIGDIFLNLRLNTNTFSTDLNQVAKSAQKSVNTSFAGMGKIITKALSVAAITSFGKSCLDLGSDLQEVQNVVDVTFPNMSDKVNDFAKSAMTSYGLSETVAKRMTGTFGSMAKAFNFSESAAYDMATELTGLAGNVASFYNLDQSEAYTKLKSVFSGETEALKDLGVVMTQNALDQYALANGYGKTTAKMSEQEKVALRMAFVTEQLSAASGDFARTSDSWANKIKVLSLNFDSLRATLGQGLINVLSPIVTWLNLIIVKLMEAAKWFVAFTSLFTKQKISQSTSNISKNVSSSANGAKNLAKNMNEVGNNAKKAAKQMGALATFDEINNIGTSQDIGGSGIGSPINDINNIDLSVTNTSLNETNELVEKIKTKWNEFVEKYDSGAKVIIAITAGIVAGLATIGAFVGIAKLSIVLGNAATAATTFFTAIKNFGVIKVILTGIGTALGGVTWPIVAIAAGIGTVTAALVYLYQTSESFRKLVKSAVGNIQSVLQNLWTSVLQPLFVFLGTMFTSVIMPIASFLSSTFVSAVNVLGSVFLNVWNEILAPLANFLITRFGENFRNWSSTAINAVSGVKNVFANLSSFISTVFETIKGVLNGIITFISGAFTGNWKKAWQGIKDIFSSIVSGFANIFKAPINAIIKGINSFISGLNKIKIPNWVPGVGGKGFNISKIPLLANGGYFQANSPQLAIIGDNKTQGEIVSPENKMYEVMMSALKSYGGTGNGNMNVIVEAIYQVLEAIKQLRLVVDGDSLSDDKNKRDEERALRTGRLIYDN